MGTINVYDKIMIETRNIRKNIEIKFFLHKSPSNTWSTNGIHSWLSRADAIYDAYRYFVGQA